MSTGPDGQTSERAIAYLVEIEHRAARVTGPKKIFNDAAQTVDKISAEVKFFWLENYFHCVGGRGLCNRTTIDDELKANIAVLEELMKRLPDDDADLCRDFIGAVRENFALKREIQEVTADNSLRVYRLEDKFRSQGNVAALLLRDKALAPA